MSEIIIYGNELYHHGIKGQKWGERRYQNSDGSLTPEGRVHYGYGEARSRLGDAKANLQTARRENIKNKLLYGVAGSRLSESGKAASSDYRKAKSDYKQAKRDYKEAKKVKKVEDYRDKYLKRAKDNSDYWNQSADEEEQSAENIKKYGVNSKEYQEYLKLTRPGATLVYDSDMPIASLAVSALSVGAALYNESYQKKVAQQTLDEMYAARKKDAAYFRAEAEKFEKAHKDLMNMEISQLTTKKDVRKTYRSK